MISVAPGVRVATSVLPSLRTKPNSVDVAGVSSGAGRHIGVPPPEFDESATLPERDLHVLAMACGGAWVRALALADSVAAM